MNRRFLIIFILTISLSTELQSQLSGDTLVYLITCSPGTATYSIYGHSALRVVIPSSGYDMVYNWGVFDFNTPHFIWKFAKGRLDYMLGVYPYELFLREYFMDKRSVYSQRVNLDGKELKYLMFLLDENLKPENIYYRYDFFYDNCSTRIRDLFEKILYDRLYYPPDERINLPTFRDRISEYQRKYPWLKAGVDFALGLPADKKAYFRNRMFLPEDLQKNLTQALIGRNNKTVPLLQPVETIFEFDPPEIKTPFYLSPMFVLGIVFILVLFVSVQLRNSVFINYIDILIFALFSVLALLLVFFNFITDHTETKMNINIIWINPFIIICLIFLILNKSGFIWFRIVFWLAVFFLIIALIFISKINSAFIPVALILALRSSSRSDFSWTPFGTREIAA
ncbi:MAG: lipoprotein N-acyltransferase Lnb domain-containing protein [Bacteroidales bacterium]